MISEGTSASVYFIVDEATTAIALGSGDVSVLGTPKVVALVEQAAVACLSGRLERGATTVGTSVSVDHLAPSVVGATVIASATITAVEGRSVTFAVKVTEADATVANGTHTRVVVDRDRFAGS